MQETEALFVHVHDDIVARLYRALLNHLAALGFDDAVEKLVDLFAAVDADDEHSLEAADLYPALAGQDGNAVTVTERGDGQEGQLLLLLVVEVEQRVSGVVASRKGRGGAGAAGGNVVGHGDTGVDEGEGSGVEQGGEERAVLGEDV